MMAPDARVNPAPSPSLTTNGDPAADSSVTPRMTPTATTACEQAIHQQRQQTISTPNGPGRLHRSLSNQRKLPLTPLGYPLAPNPRHDRNLSSQTPSRWQPNLPDPEPKKALNPTVETSLVSDNRAPPEGE